jgi:hypothetical protein
MAKKQTEEGPMQVDINVLNDGTVSLVFTRSLTQFTASADEMAQLGMNLIKASQVASMQPQIGSSHVHSPALRKM